MAQVIENESLRSELWSKVKGLVVVESSGFTNKTQINLKGIGLVVVAFLVVFCLVVLFMPAAEVPTRTYSEKSTGTNAATNQTQVAPQNSQPDPLSTSNFHRSIGIGSSGSVGGGASLNRNSSMIIARDNDSSTTLPPGTTFLVKLAQSVTATSRSIPIIAVVATNVTSDNSLAIPENSKIFGEALLDTDSERANITFKSIILPDGRSRPVSAIALGADNQAGVEGEYHSDALKNTAGQLVARFAAGVAQGAVTRTPFGGSQGGIQNGLLQGVSDTAKDRADAWSEELKKPRAWIELTLGQRFQIVLTQPFTFRDPGGVN